MTATLISGCMEGAKIEKPDSRTKAEIQRDENGSFLGLGNKLGGRDKQLEGNLININAYLWRASLDTLSVNPIEKVDVESGLVQTEWVSTKSDGSEQTKISVIVISADLKTSGLRVNVYKRKKVDGSWVNQSVQGETVSAVEGAILQRARELRLSDTTN
ncbi:MAG: DUF3576 domain-containing protein [Alphaproteobacteria bacterium]